MNKKGLKNNKEYNKWNQPNLVNQFKKEFVAFVKPSKKGKDIIKNIDLIGWERIIEISNIEIESLVSSFEIPVAFYKENWLITFYEIELLKLIKNHLFYKLLVEMERLEEKRNVQKTKVLKKITKQAETDIKEIAELFKIQTKFSSLKWINNPEILQLNIDELKELAEKGKKFSPGKKNKKKEIEKFKMIEQRHSQSIKDGIELKYRSIAFHIARTELDFFQDGEQQNFYDRFLEWRKKNKKN